MRLRSPADLEDALLCLLCYEVLSDGDPATARALLERSQALIQAAAAAIPDAENQLGYLCNIPHHRALEEAWVTQRNA